MGCEVEYTDEFGAWWESLDAGEQDAIDRHVQLLEDAGIQLRFPHCSGIAGSRYPHMRELRVQYHGRPYRVLYAFDPRRTAILLIGGDKTGNVRWYEQFVPLADRLYAEHLDSLRQEMDNG